jgi:hypothetical protein
MTESTTPIRSLDFAAAKGLLDGAIRDRDSRRVGLLLVHPSLILRRQAADALGQFGGRPDVPELIAALEANQVVYGGGTEDQVLKEDLNAALIAAVQKLTGLDLGPVDPASDADIRRALEAARKWRAQSV